MKPKDDWRRCDCGSGQTYFNKEEVVCRACGARYPRSEFEKRKPQSSDKEKKKENGPTGPVTPIGGEDVKTI